MLFRSPSAASLFLPAAECDPRERGNSLSESSKQSRESGAVVPALSSCCSRRKSAPLSELWSPSRPDAHPRRTVITRSLRQWMGHRKRPSAQPQLSLCPPPSSPILFSDAPEKEKLGESDGGLGLFDDYPRSPVWRVPENAHES